MPGPYDVTLAVVGSDQGIAFLLRSDIDFLMDVARVLAELYLRSVRIIADAVFGLPDNATTNFGADWNRPPTA